MRINLILIFFLCTVATGLSQNLVSNGSFESGGCPVEGGFDPGKSPLNWVAPFNPVSTPDYFTPCADPVLAWRPGQNSQGCQNPLNGQSFTGIGAFSWSQGTGVSGDGSEYMVQTLQHPLTSGQTYYIEFWVAATDGGTFDGIISPETAYSKNLGMLLTNNANDFNTVHNVNTKTPQIKAQNFITAAQGWTRISGTFKPTTSGFQFIVIGNFDNGFNTSTATTNNFTFQANGNASTYPGFVSAYYYVDAVTIIPSNQNPPVVVPYISGNANLCSTGTTYSLQNQPYGTTVTWNATPPSLFQGATSGSGTSANLKAASNGHGTGTLTYTISSVCGSSPVSLSLQVGVPNLAMINGPTTGCINDADDYNFSAALNQYTTAWNWSVFPSTAYITSGQGSYIVNIDFLALGSYTIECDITTQCGVVQTFGSFLANCGGGGDVVRSFSATPNPANSSLLVSPLSNSNTTANIATTGVTENTVPKPFAIKLLDKTGKVSLSGQSTDGMDLILDTSQLQSGFYYLLVISGNDHVEETTVLVSH